MSFDYGPLYDRDVFLKVFFTTDIRNSRSNVGHGESSLRWSGRSQGAVSTGNVSTVSNVLLLEYLF